MLYDCASGKLLTALAPPPVQASVANALTNLITWAPNGHQLAYYDVTSGTLTIWDSAALPA